MAAGATYEPIATTTLGSAQTTITFSSIPSTYTDLVLISNASITSGASAMQFRFNSDSGTNYSFTRMYGDGSTAGSDASSSQNTMGVAIMGSSVTPQTACITHIQNYANTTTYKTVISRGNNAASYVSAYVSLWRSTSAINRIDIYFKTAGTDTAVAGSTFTLYGITAA